VTWQQPGYLKGLDGAKLLIPSYTGGYYLDPDAFGFLPPPEDFIRQIKETWLSAREDDPDGHGIVKGDIVYVKRAGVQHMMMVVGWGPVLLSWEAVDQFDPSTLIDSYPSPGDSLYGQVVPYLVDHGLHGATELGTGGIPTPICLTCTRPRPYYVLYWSRTVPGINTTYTLSGLDREDNPPLFISIPDTVSVPIENLKDPPRQQRSDSSSMISISEALFSSAERW